MARGADRRRADEAQGNPVAAALLDTLRANSDPPPHLIENAIAARQFDLYDDPFPTIGDLEAYLGETRSGLLQIAALVLAEGRDLGAAEASGLAGVALGLVGLLRGIHGPRPLAFAPADCWRGTARRCGFPRTPPLAGLTAALGELVALARRRLDGGRGGASQTAARRLRPAYAGLATAPLWLAAIERGRAPPQVAAWRRQWALWRWSRNAS